MAEITGIINYGMGNIRSVYNALDYLGEEVVILESEDNFEQCSHLILPGVGAFPKAIENIVSTGIDRKIKTHTDAGKPLLGICLGMQLLASVGHEVKKTEGLNLIKGSVEKIDVSIHIPHVGWNNIKVHRDHPVFMDMNLSVDFYFVHSYHFNVHHPENLLATTDYEKDLTAIVSNEKSVLGVQFHPEKSQENGLKLLENFCKWNGKIR